MRSIRRWGLAAALLLPLGARAGTLVQNALDFAGDDDRVQLSALPPFIGDLSQDFTITLWLRKDASATQRVFFAQRDTMNFVSVLLGSAGEALFYVRRDGIMYSASTASTVIPDGVWTHLAVRWTAASNLPEILFDGVLITTAPGGSSSIGTSGVMMLGARTDGLQTLNGALDDFAIWSGARSNEQVRADRVSTCVPTTGLQASYDFNVGTPGGNNAGVITLPDVAGNAHPGALAGFTLDGASSNWIASPVARIAPGLVFDPPLADLATGEDGSGYTGTLRLAVPPAAPVTVTLGSSDPAEAVPSPAQLVFTADDWDQPQAIAVGGVDDELIDGDAGFTFTASSASADLCQAGLLASQPGINADDDSGSVAIAAALLAEGDEGAAAMPFEVVYTGATAPAFTVEYATQDGSAVAGTDYVATSGTLAFTGTPGETLTTSVPVIGNRAAQGDRTFALQLGAPSNPRIGLDQAGAQGSIVDDDVDVRVTLDDGLGVVQAGQTVVYDLVVSNLSPVLDAGLVPVSFVAVPLQDLAWSCTASGGGSCTGGAGSFAGEAALPPGAQASYTVTGVVSPMLGSAGGPQQLVATATATLASDSQPGDNIAVDVDAGVRVFADGFE